MKYLKHFLIAVCMCLMLVGTSWAIPSTPDAALYDDILTMAGYSAYVPYGGFGTKIGQYDNLPANQLLSFITNELKTLDYINADYAIEMLDKAEDGNPATGELNVVGYGEDSEGNPEEKPYIDATYGGWGSLPAIDFWIVKATNKFSLWTYGLVGPGSLKPSDIGYWTTVGIGHGNHELSHFSAYYDPQTPPENPVPEPATIFLFGAGLLGLAAVQRKRLNKKNNK